jgi:hypothetical protein
MELNEIKQTKWMHIHCVANTGKTKKFYVFADNNAFLGEIRWFVRWRQYAFFPENSVFEKQCLQDIVDFLKELAEERKINKTK